MIHTKVVFRVWKSGHGKGDVIALFPDIVWESIRQSYCASYMHLGQHGGADYNLVIQKTRPATPKEYGALRDELKQLGYNLIIRERRT